VVVARIATWDVSVNTVSLEPPDRFSVGANPLGSKFFGGRGRVPGRTFPISQQRLNKRWSVKSLEVPCRAWKIALVVQRTRLEKTNLSGAAPCPAP
jgi:hypothetical protein